MPYEPEDWPVDEVPGSEAGASAVVRLVNFGTGKAQLRLRHIAKLTELRGLLSLPSTKVVIVGHASARNNSVKVKLNSDLSEARSNAVADKIRLMSPGAAILFFGQSDSDHKAILKAEADAKAQHRGGIDRKFLTPNSGFFRAVTVKIFQGQLPPETPRPVKLLQFQIGIGSGITIQGIDLRLPAGSAKKVAEEALRKISPEARKRIFEFLKKLGKHMKDEFDVPLGIAIGLVNISGELVIKDESGRREKRAKFSTLSAAVTEGDGAGLPLVGIVDTTLINAGFKVVSARDTFDVSSLLETGSRFSCLITRLDSTNLKECSLKNQFRVSLITESSVLIPFRLQKGSVPLMCGVDAAELTPP